MSSDIWCDTYIPGNYSTSHHAGGMNVDVCLRHEIPLYLGSYSLQRSSSKQQCVLERDVTLPMKQSTVRYASVPDCLAIFLFIWLLVGTYWIVHHLILRNPHM